MRGRGRRGGGRTRSDLLGFLASLPSCRCPHHDELSAAGSDQLRSCLFFPLPFCHSVLALAQVLEVLKTMASLIAAER